MMATLEDELKDLKEKNNELVQKVQYWKMTAAQRENEKLNLMKEINELRLKLSRLRSNGSDQANNLDAALQSASEKALAHLVRASDEIARTMELTKAYMRDRQELDAASPRWSSIGSTPTSVKKDKVHRVPPLMIGGQSIQPVVALTMLNTSNPRSTTRSPNRNVTTRAVPVRMLQDVYIPLTRIDAGDAHTESMEAETEANNADDSAENLGLNDNEEIVLDESQRMSEDEDFDSTQRLEAVTEDLEPEDEVTPPRNRTDNPLEGPSWMLDASNDDQASAPNSLTNLEPDSTTELEEGSHRVPPNTINKRNNSTELAPLSVRVSCEFSPTVRRRKRTSSPPPPSPAAPRHLSHFSPRAVSSRRTSNSGRVLKVLVAKMRLDGAVAEAAAAGAEAEAGAGDVSPPKRPAPALAYFDAPSPNGATVAGVIVSEAVQDGDGLASGEPVPPARRSSQAGPRRAGARAADDRDARASRDGSVTRRGDSRSVSRERDSHVESRAESRSRRGSHDSHDSDSGSGGDAGEGRTRRPRKVVTYKEKPLNRKMRR